MDGRRALASAALLLAAGCAGQPPAEVVFKTPVSVAPSPAAPTAREVVVVAGDTVYAIARRHNLSIRALIDANGLEPPFTLRVGQHLVLPRERVHVVTSGDTLYGVSRRYGVDMAALVRANGLSDPYRLTVGQRLRLPATGAAQAAAPPAPAPTTSTAGTGAVASSGAPPAPPPKPAIVTASTVSTATAVGTLPPPRSKSTFLWPVEGKVIAGFGPKSGGLHNDGINIVAPRGAAVRAAENGVVAYIGNELRGYGNLILIRHADGWITAYAHNDVVLVKRGDTVRRGDIIGRVGSTGNVTTPQSHFELRRGVRTVDPLKYLAKY